MSYDVDYSVDGYEFGFYDGRVTINPKENVEQTSFLPALKKAQLLCPLVDAMIALETSYEVVRYGYHEIPDDYLSEILEVVSRIESSNDMQIPAQYINAVNDLRQEWQNRETDRSKQAKVSGISSLGSGYAGYVYLLKSMSGYYKIGRTKNPKNRLATFSVKLPFEVEFEHVIECRDMYRLEKSLHSHFAERRVNGEWFDLSADDVAYIKSIGGEA